MTPLIWSRDPANLLVPEGTLTLGFKDDRMEIQEVRIFHPPSFCPFATLNG